MESIKNFAPETAEIHGVVHICAKFCILRQKIDFALCCPIQLGIYGILAMTFYDVIFP